MQVQGSQGRGQIHCNPRSQTHRLYRSRRREMDFVTSWSGTSPACIASRFAFWGIAAQRKKLRRMSFSRCIRTSIACNRRSTCWPGCAGLRCIARPMPAAGAPVELIFRRTNFVRNKHASMGAGSAGTHGAFEPVGTATSIEQMVAIASSGTTRSPAAAISGRLDCRPKYPRCSRCRLEL